MNLTLAVFNEASLLKLVNSDLDLNIVVNLKHFSKRGEISSNFATNLLPSKKIKFELNFDLPFFDLDAKKYFDLKDTISLASSVRVQDLGLAHFIKNKFPETKIALNLLYHSKTSLAWNEYAGYFNEHLIKIIVSPEIPYQDLSEIITKVKNNYPNLQFEAMVAGKLLLYHTLREMPYADDHYKLVQLDKADVAPLELSKSQAGSFIFFGHDLFIFDLTAELKKSNLDIYNLEMVDDEVLNEVVKNYNDAQLATKLKSIWPNPTSHGFFKINRSDAPLRRLKSKARDNNAIGIILEHVSHSHCLIEFYSAIALPVKLIVVTPNGDRLETQINQLTTLQNVAVFSVDQAGYYISKPIHKALQNSILIAPDNN